jgi:hypothetical protein
MVRTKGGKGPRKMSPGARVVVARPQVGQPRRPPCRPQAQRLHPAAPLLRGAPTLLRHRHPERVFQEGKDWPSPR